MKEVGWRRLTNFVQLHPVRKFAAEHMSITKFYCGNLGNRKASKIFYHLSSQYFTAVSISEQRKLIDTERFRLKIMLFNIVSRAQI